MRFAWLLGWAVPESWFVTQVLAAFPFAKHSFFPASPDWLAQMSASGPWDAIAGYSLGTQLLLREAAAVGGLTPRVALLAPVLAFPKEAGLGGKVKETQIRYLSRWLKSDRTAALEDFYARAGLIECEADNTTTPAEVLLWGLERLANDRVEPGFPADWRAYMGEFDALMDASVLMRLEPSIVCVGGATHHPGSLMRAWAADFV